jgi:hypothetical protein
MLNYLTLFVRGGISVNWSTPFVQGGIPFELFNPFCQRVAFMLNYLTLFVRGGISVNWLTLFVQGGISHIKKAIKKQKGPQDIELKTLWLSNTLRDGETDLMDELFKLVKKWGKKVPLRKGKGTGNFLRMKFLD